MYNRLETMNGNTIYMKAIRLAYIGKALKLELYVQALDMIARNERSDPDFPRSQSLRLRAHCFLGLDRGMESLRLYFIAQRLETPSLKMRAITAISCGKYCCDALKPQEALLWYHFAEVVDPQVVLTHDFCYLQAQAYHKLQNESEAERWFDRARRIRSS